VCLSDVVPIFDRSRLRANYMAVTKYLLGFLPNLPKAKVRIWLVGEPIGGKMAPCSHTNERAVARSTGVRTRG